MHRLRFFVQRDPGGPLESRWVDVEHLVCAGFAGRDRESVQAHIDELREEGISAPDDIPAFYHVTPDLLTTDDAIAVQFPGTSPEVEWVLIATEDGFLVTVGSDHTDRELEKADMARSKQVCRKVVSPLAWTFSSVEDRWDDLQLRSWVAVGGGDWVPYQDAPAGSLLAPRDLFAALRDAQGLEVGPGWVVLGGTVPRLAQQTDADRVRIELADPAGQRAISHCYRVLRVSQG